MPSALSTVCPSCPKCSIGVVSPFESSVGPRRPAPTSRLLSSRIDAFPRTTSSSWTGRGVTVEAFQSVFEKEIDGFSVLFHQISYEKVGTSTIQSRACAGVAKGTYLFALPGSPGAVKDGWDGILKWQLDIRHRPCNFVEILPRLTEQ